MSKRNRLSIPTLRVALLRVAFLLALIIVGHQFVMTTPAHRAIMPLMNGDAQASVPTQNSLNCPPCPLHRITVCPAVQATLPAGMNAGFLLFAALVAMVIVFRVTGPGMIATADWRPPPRDTLVLYQAFRC